ncbi:MAG: copper chaperone PCu(A)C [Pseudomonadota bacterium]
MSALDGAMLHTCTITNEQVTREPIFKMIHYRSRFIFSALRTCLALACSILATVVTASAHDYGNKKIAVDHPWAPPTLSKSAPAAGYFSIKNNADAEDKLVAVKIATDVAESAELHRSIVDGDIRRMQQLTDGLTIPAGETVTFAPRDYHVMIFGLRSALTVGDKFKATLVFENAGDVPVEFWVEDGDGSKDGAHSHD